MLPTVDFFGTQITRLTLGDNPAHGNSYIPSLISRDELEKYYTQDNTVKMLFSAVEAGCNTIVALASPHMLGALRQFKAQGGKLHIIFQTYPPSIDNFAENINEMMELYPIAIYHQGSTGEHLIESNEVDTYLKNIETIKKTGLPAGMAFHVPEHVLRAESEGWGADFYVICPYNARRNRTNHQSSFISGSEVKPDFISYIDDRLVMFPIIRQINKPVVVIKPLAGGQVFHGKPKDEYAAIIEHYFAECFANIKPSDVLCVGVFQRDIDHIKQNADITARILGS